MEGAGSCWQGTHEDPLRYVQVINLQHFPDRSDDVIHEISRGGLALYHKTGLGAMIPGIVELRSLDQRYAYAAARMDKTKPRQTEALHQLPLFVVVSWVWFDDTAAPTIQ